MAYRHRGDRRHRRDVQPNKDRRDDRDRQSEPGQPFEHPAKRPGEDDQQQPPVGDQRGNCLFDRADAACLVDDVVQQQGRPQHGQHEQRDQQRLALRYPYHVEGQPKQQPGDDQSHQPACRTGTLPAPMKPGHQHDHHGHWQRRQQLAQSGARARGRATGEQHDQDQQDQCAKPTNPCVHEVAFSDARPGARPEPRAADCTQLRAGTGYCSQAFVTKFRYTWRSLG